MGNAAGIDNVVTGLARRSEFRVDEIAWVWGFMTIRTAALYMDFEEGLVR